MKIQSYRELEIWQVAMDLAELCYRATQRFPREEIFGLTSQIRQAAVSVPANIAEGHGREHTREFLQHLRIARGSRKELETHLLISKRICLLDSSALDDLLALTDRIGRMLTSLRKALQAKL